MNEQTHAVTSSPAELSFEEMSAVHGGTGFRYEPDASTGTNHNL